MINQSVRQKFLSLIEKCLQMNSGIHSDLRAVEQNIKLSLRHRGYRPEHFQLYELVPEEVYNSIGERAWLHFDPYLLWSMDSIWSWFYRKYGYCVIIVNTWYWGGGSQYRGYRPPECGVGGAHSLHRSWNAVDFIVYKNKSQRLSSSEVFNDITSNYQRDEFCYVNRIEDYKFTEGYTHIDRANTDTDGIVVFTP